MNQGNNRNKVTLGLRAQGIRDIYAARHHMHTYDDNPFHRNAPSELVTAGVFLNAAEEKGFLSHSDRASLKMLEVEYNLRHPGYFPSY